MWRGCACCIPVGLASRWPARPPRRSPLPSLTARRAARRDGGRGGRPASGRCAHTDVDARRNRCVSAGRGAPREHTRTHAAGRVLDTTRCVSGVLLERHALIRAYHSEYVAGFERSADTLARLRATNRKFEAWLVRVARCAPRGERLASGWRAAGERLASGWRAAGERLTSGCAARAAAGPRVPRARPGELPHHARAARAAVREHVRAALVPR